MRHAILGPGGVGGLIGALLADAGEDVTLIVRPGTESLYPHEISLESPFKTLHAPVSVSAALKSSLDVLWVTVKATELELALESIPTDFRINAIVPLLNGIDHVERCASDSVVTASYRRPSRWRANASRRGRIVHRSRFIRFSILETGRRLLASPLETFQRFGFECLSVADEPTLMWSKLVFLAPLALSTSAEKSPIGDVLSHPIKAARLEASVHEACAVATQAGARVSADSVLAKIKTLPVAMRSSMERDIANGKLPELEAIAGPILRGAEGFRIELKAIPELVRDIQSIVSGQQVGKVVLHNE